MAPRGYLNQYVTFLKMCRAWWKYGYWAALLTLVTIFLQLPAPLMTRYAIDRAFPGHNLTLLNIIVIGLVLLLIFRILSGFINEILLFLFRNKAIMSVQIKLFEHIERLGMVFHNENKVGHLTSRLVQDTGNLQGLMADMLINFIRSILTFLFGICALLFIHWRLALLSLIFLPFFAYSAYFFSNKIRTRTVHLQELWADLYNVYIETLCAIPVVKAYCLEKHRASKAGEKLGDVIRANYDLTKMSIFSGSITSFIGGIGPMLILWYGGREIMAGHLTLGSYFAFVAFLGYLYSPIQTMVSINASVQRGLASLPRILELLNTPTEHTAGREVLNLHKKTPISNVSFNDISFTYNGSKPIIKNINFDIKKKEKVAIIGESGSGKTTLINLLLKFYSPIQGNIQINGVNAETIITNDLRDKIGAVLQTPFIFSGSIADNIKVGNFSATEEDIKKAAEIAELSDFVSSLPKGFQTEVGERGIKLSGGERQRLAIARVALKNPEIIILDEATSEIDVNAERHIFEMIYKTFCDKIIILITHRLYNIIKVDKVIFLENGTVKGIGNHNRLYRTIRSYRSLFDNQNVGASQENWRD